MSQTLGSTTKVRDGETYSKLSLMYIFTPLVWGVRFCVLAATPEPLGEAGEEDTPKEKETVT